MWIGLGIFLLVVGAILEFAITVDIPFVSASVLGWILMAGGLVCIILSFAVRSRRTVSSTSVARDAGVPAQGEYHEKSTGGPVA